MNPNQWDRAKEIFGEAIELEASHRESFVRDSSGGDDKLYDEVMSLLSNDEDRQSPSPLGSRLLKGRYRIERELDRGGLGVVYLAKDETLHDRLVVVKMPLSIGSDDSWLADKFAQEIKALALIDHPGVVGALDSGVAEDGRPFFVMQYVDGQSLRAAIPSQGLPLDRVGEISRQIGRALAAAHSKGVWHRDLKPANIMLQALPDGSEHVRIIDFGIATIRELQTRNPEVVTHVIGSPAYMAPEQLQGRVSAATDIYAFGAVVYEMVTGRKPFSADEPAQMISKQEVGVATKPSQLRPELPHTAEALILQALEFDPKNRPTSAAELGEDIARSLAKLRQATNRRLVIVTAVAGIAVVAAAGTAWLQKQQSGAGTQTVAFSVLVQRMRAGQPAAMPELADLKQALRPSDNFVLLVRATQAGHLYVLSEEQGTESLNTLFPSPLMYNGSSTLRRDAQIRIPEASWFRFDPKPATLALWFVWSGDEIQEFEKLKTWVNERDRGSIGDAELRSRTRRLLAEMSAAPLASRSGQTEEIVRSSTRRFAWKVSLETKEQAASELNLRRAWRESEVNLAL
jgi:hypothetical protein